MHVTTIYVLPTEEGRPPRAILGHTDVEENEVIDAEMLDILTAVARGEALAVFSNDMGCWTVQGNPVPTEVSEAISDHARNLGVPGF